MLTLATLARHLNFGAGAGRIGCGLVLMTDAARIGDPRPAIRRLPSRSLVVFRHYGSPDRDALANAVARLCRQRRLTALIAGDFRLAVSLGTGLHLPEAMLRGAGPRLRLWHRRTGRCLSSAAHDRQALVEARRLGADLVLLAPVFPTLSHPGQPVLGLLAFRRLVRQMKRPVCALGGVTIATVRGLRGSGAAGVAAVGGLA